MHDTMTNWGFTKTPMDNYDRWPVDAAGEKIRPAYLTHLGGAPMDLSVELSVLEAYGIPTILEYPNNGDFGVVVMGHAGGGVDVYVPETMLEDAVNLIKSDNATIDEEDIQE